MARAAGVFALCWTAALAELSWFERYFQMARTEEAHETRAPDASGAIPLVTFDGAPATTQHWQAVNDPVMGGVSVATFHIEGGVGVFDGEVKIVPSLKAPGFCTMRVRGTSFPDISGAGAFELVVKNSRAYTGFKMSIGPAPRTGWFASYKADLEVPVSDGWQTLRVPFSNFSSKWSDTTGEPTVRCSENPGVCPDADHLKRLTDMEIMGEGVAGQFHLEVKSISAVVKSISTVQAVANMTAMVV